MASEKSKNGEESRKKIYDFIVSYVSENNYAPTVREIANGTGFKSTNTVYNHLHKLQKMGIIELGEFSNPRSIKIKEYGQKELVENFGRIAIQQVENHLLAEMDKCNQARIEAIKEDKVYSEVKRWKDMQVIYGLLAKYLQTLE